MKTQLPILAIIAALAMIAALALVGCDSGPPTAKDLGYTYEEWGLEKGDTVALTVVGGLGDILLGSILEMDQKGIMIKLSRSTQQSRTYFPWPSVKGIRFNKN